MNDADKVFELSQFLTNTTDLTASQSLFLVENNFEYWDEIHDQLISIFVLIKQTKQMLERMGIK